MTRCSCGFQPARGSSDQAKSYLLSDQFRSASELTELAQKIRSGQPVAFGDEELRLGMAIATWNAAVTASFLAFAVLLGLLIGGAVAGLSGSALAAIGASAALAGVVAFGLMAHVDGKVSSLRLTSNRTDIG